MWFSTAVLLKVCTALYPVSVGESWVFDSGLTKVIPCIVPSERSEVVGVRQGQA